MRVFIDGYIFWIQREGGISRYWSELLSKMALISGDTQFYLYLRPHSIDRIPTGSNIRLLEKKTRWPAKLYGLLENAIICRHLSRFRPDVFHSTYYTTVRSSQIPKVVTVYDTIYELFPRSFPPNVDHLFARKKEVITSADTIIAISQNTKNDLVSIYDLPEDKIEVICPGVDRERFKPEPNQESTENFRERYSLSKPYFLYVGRRMGYKNFQTLLDAFATSHLKDNYLLVAIGGEEELSVKESETIESHRLSPSLRFLRRIPTDELILAYRSACTLIVPSLYEGFGLSILEAMACGCPVLASNTSSLPEAVGDAGIMFDPESIDDLKGALEQVTDPVLRQRLRARGLGRVPLFSWEGAATKVLTAYREVTDGA